METIDYTKENLVHADMSPDEFAKSMKDRGESFFGMFFRMMGQAMAKQSAENAKATPEGKKRSGSSDIDLLAAFFDKDRAGTLKRVMAEQFEDLEGMMDALNGTKGSTIITERNKVVLKKLDEQIAGGNKKIAIFFGAGHMSHIEKQLEADLHLSAAAARSGSRPGSSKRRALPPRGRAERTPEAECPHLARATSTRSCEPARLSSAALSHDGLAPEIAVRARFALQSAADFAYWVTSIRGNHFLFAHGFARPDA